MTTDPAAPTALYRLYDAQDELLYIGVSGNPPARFRAHARRRHWWFQVHSHTLEWIEGRGAAIEAEKRAIRAEEPRWNREHMPVWKVRYDRPVPPPRRPDDSEARYVKVELARDELDEVLAAREKIRAEFHEAIRDAFPETHGQPTKRGVLAEVARRSGYSREHVAQLRDGKDTP
jgi:predicted GIY-YIG superfamily endonuclease